MAISIVSCTNCKAEISDDREACPHCGAAIVSPYTKLTALEDQNAKLRKTIADHEAALVAENAELAAKAASIGKPKN